MENVDHNARSLAQRALDRIDSHENICAERYAGIVSGLDKMNDRLTGYLVSTLGVAVFIILALVGLIYANLEAGL